MNIPRLLNKDVKRNRQDLTKSYKKTAESAIRKQNPMFINHLHVGRKKNHATLLSVETCHATIIL